MIVICLCVLDIKLWEAPWKAANTSCVKDKKNMIIAEFSITPIGTGSTSVSKYVKAAHSALRKLGIPFKAGAMSTTLEARTLDEIFQAVKKAEAAMLKQGAKRVAIYIKIDDRRDKEATIKSKVQALK